MTTDQAQRIASSAIDYIAASDVVHSLRARDERCELHEATESDYLFGYFAAGRADCVWRVEHDDEDDEVCEPCKATLAKRAGLADARKARNAARTRMRRAVKAVRS